MSTVPRVVIKLVVQHSWGRSFSVLAERDHRPYLITYDRGHTKAYRCGDTPSLRVEPDTLRLTVTDGLTPIDLTVDPLCEAIMGRGWHASHLWLSASGQPGQEDSIRHFAYHKGRLLPQFLTWTGSKQRYVIVPEVQESRHWSSSRCPWLILVHLADNGHFHISASVPDVYQPEVLTTLLAAIATIPHASTVPDAHPASLAR